MRSPATVTAWIAVLLLFASGPGCALLEPGRGGQNPPGGNDPSGGTTHSTLAEADRDGELTLADTGLKTLEIQSGPGPLVVTASPQHQAIDVYWQITTWAGTMKEARRLRQETQVNLVQRDGTSALLKVDAPSLVSSDQRWAASLQVRIPARLKLVVVDSEGDISISGVQGGTQVTNAEGRVGVQGTAGGVYLSNGGGPTSISEVTGRVTVDDGPGDITISTISGNVEIRGGHGKLKIFNIDGNVTARDILDGVSVEYIEGDLELWDLVPSPANIQKLRDVSGEFRFPKSKTP